MNNRQKLFDYQDHYLNSRSEYDFNLLLQEIKKLGLMIQNKLISERKLKIQSEIREDNIQDLLLYFISKYNDESFFVTISFYSLIYLTLFGFLFDTNAKKRDAIHYYEPAELYKYHDKDFEDRSCHISFIDKHIKEYEYKEYIYEILDVGKNYKSQLYKIKDGVIRKSVEDKMIELKSRIYSTIK